eukprot:5678774-Karenia_brevis.AAC.1
MFCKDCGKEKAGECKCRKRGAQSQTGQSPHSKEPRMDDLDSEMESAEEQEAPKWARGLIRNVG